MEGGEEGEEGEEGSVKVINTEYEGSMVINDT